MAAEYANSKGTKLAIVASPRLYWRVSGIALAAIAVLGIVLNASQGNNTWIGDQNFLVFDWTHNIVHVVLAALALTFGFVTFKGDLSKHVAKVVGIVYLTLGVVGFISADLFGLGGSISLHLEWGENVIHLLLGAWGAYVGFMG